MESIQANIKLTIINEKAITTSRQIAYHFNKRHDNVLQGIENLDCSPQFNRLNFQAVDYNDGKGEVRKEYQITRDGFVYLVMGFTGKRAAQFKEAYIEAFNKMELELQKRYQSKLQWGEPTLNDVLSMGHSVEKTQIEITHTKQGDIISVNKLTEESPTKPIHQASIISTRSSWIPLVETFFAEIDGGSIPETMRKNLLIANELITSETGQQESHPCLFFRATNLMTLFCKDPRFFDLLKTSNIHTAKLLLSQLKKSGVLAFGGKEKEKGIPVDPNTSSKTRRVSHLVAIDLFILERDYAILMPDKGTIAKLLY